MYFHFEVASRPRKKRVKQTPAVLLRVEKREIHGELVDVQVWSPGPSPEPPRLLSPDEVKRNWALAREAARTEYDPTTELNRVGLPVQR